MNYQKIYDNLINRAQDRILDCYVERHHIIPRCIGGSDVQSNIVELTAREHFIAHMLLAKIHGGKLIHAAYMMSTRGGYTNRQYAKIREEHARFISENAERAKKISQTLTGRVRTDEHSRNIGFANKGRVITDEWKEKISKSMSGSGNPMFGKTHSEQSRRIISEANKQKIVCPYCNKEGGIAIMKRWHFDLCNLAPNPIQRKKYPVLICPHCNKEGGGAQMISNHFDNCRQRP